MLVTLTEGHLERLFKGAGFAIPEDERSSLACASASRSTLAAPVRSRPQARSSRYRLSPLPMHARAVASRKLGRGLSGQHRVARQPGQAGDRSRR